MLRSVRRRNILRSRGLLSQSTALFRVRLSAIVRLIAARQACREVSPAYKQGSTLQITPTLLPLFDKAAAAEHSFLDPIAKTVTRVLPRKSASRTATNKLSPTTPKQSLTKFKLSTTK